MDSILKKMASDPVDVCPNMTAQNMMCSGARGDITGECDSCMKRALEEIKKEKTKSRDERRKEEKKLMKKRRKAGKSQQTEGYQIEEPTSSKGVEIDDETEKRTAENLTETKGNCSRFLHRLCCFGTGQDKVQKVEKLILDELSVEDSAEIGTAAGVGASPQVVSPPPVKPENKDPENRTDITQDNLPASTDIHEQVPESAAGFKKQKAPKGKQKRSPKKDNKGDKKILDQASENCASTSKTGDRINPQVTKPPPSIKPENKDPDNRTDITQDNLPASTDIHEQIPESARFKKQKAPKGKEKRSPVKDNKGDKRILDQASENGSSTSKTGDRINPQVTKPLPIKVAKKETNVTEGDRNGDPNKPSTSKASRKPHEQKEIRKYEQDGKIIKDKFCNTEGPTMFPPAPINSPYIDKYPEGSNLTKGNEQDRRRQEDDEAEVSVFRALESLGSAHGRNMVALQGLEYTHGQYSLFVGDHESAKKKDCPCTMKNKEKEGECDFVVMGPNYVVVLEVKNVESNDGSITIEQQKKVFLDNLNKARDQAERTVKLVEKIQDNVSSGTSTTVLRFASFPGFEKRHLVGFQLTDDEKKDIIFKEDLRDFKNWWVNNVRTKISSESHHFPEQHQKVEHILLSLWCDQKGKCNKDKCSLGHCIKEIDKKLKDANVTFRRRKHDHNPGIKEAPDVFKKYIGINNLTVEQYDLYNSTQNALWVNGPAGSGKTILMLAKIIQLVSEVHAEEKVVLFTFGNTESSREKCESVLHKADIKFELIYTDYGKHTSHELSELILEQSSQVVIVVTGTLLTPATLLKDTVSLLYECHLLLDDMQCVLTGWGEDEEVLADLIRSISTRVKHTSLEGTTRTTWIACDMVQELYYISDISNITKLLLINLPDKMQVTLSVNLRNTFDICNMLTVIRGEVRGQYSTDVLNVILPIQQPGHYIHGMRPVIHILPCRDEDLIRDIVVHELDKLCQSGGLQQNTDIGIVYTRYDIESVLVAIAKDRSNQSGQITVCYRDDSYSAEWPAGIVVYEMGGDTFYYRDLCNLYLSVSRARVYCSIIVYPDEGYTLKDYKKMIRFFNKLDTNLVHVKRY